MSTKEQRDEWQRLSDAATFATTSSEALGSLLRFGRKQEGPWDDAEGDLPTQNQAHGIHILIREAVPALLQDLAEMATAPAINETKLNASLVELRAAVNGAGYEDGCSLIGAVRSIIEQANQNRGQLQAMERRALAAEKRIHELERDSATLNGAQERGQQELARLREEVQKVAAFVLYVAALEAEHEAAGAAWAHVSGTDARENLYIAHAAVEALRTVKP